MHPEAVADDPRSVRWVLAPEAVPVQGEVGVVPGGLGALLINSRRLADPIAIHYSQASFRTNWMLRNRPKGDTWVDRTSSTERLDSDFLRLRESYCYLVEDLGLQYRFVSYNQLENHELSRGGYRVLILPDSQALSAAEAAAIREFMSAGGTVARSIATNYPERVSASRMRWNWLCQATDGAPLGGLAKRVRGGTHFTPPNIKPCK